MAISLKIGNAGKMLLYKEVDTKETLPCYQPWPHSGLAIRPGSPNGGR